MKARKILFAVLAVVGLLLAGWMAYVFSVPAEDVNAKVWLLTDDVQSVDAKRWRGVATETGMDSCLSFLEGRPQARVWFHIGTLADEDFDAYVDTLGTRMARMQADRSQLVMEGTQLDVLNWFNKQHIYTVYTMDAACPSSLTQTQIDSVVVRMSRVAESGCARAICIPTCWYGIMRGLYRESGVEYVVRRPDTSLFWLRMSPRGQRMLRDSRVRIIAVRP